MSYLRSKLPPGEIHKAFHIHLINNFKYSLEENIIWSSQGKSDLSLSQKFLMEFLP